MVIEREIPIRTVSEANMRTHYMAKARRVSAQRNAVRLILRVPVHAVRLPAVVLLTRLAPSSGLDDDNLRSSMKAVRDGVADALGIDDRDPRVAWHYAQERSPRGVYSVRIRIMAAAVVAAS
jgi:hypothetical protein